MSAIGICITRPVTAIVLRYPFRLRRLQLAWIFHIDITLSATSKSTLAKTRFERSLCLCFLDVF